jgi:hypothetical protein
VRLVPARKVSEAMMPEREGSRLEDQMEGQRSGESDGKQPGDALKGHRGEKALGALLCPEVSCGRLYNQRARTYVTGQTPRQY